MEKEDGKEANRICALELNVANVKDTRHEREELHKLLLT